VGTSYNGWPASADPTSIGIDPSFTAGGVSFPGGCKSGDVALVLGYVAQKFAQNVEPLVAGTCWGYDFRVNRNDPNTLSCHASGTALDLNSPQHANGASGTFTPAQVDWINQILRDVGGVVVWGGGWSDEMHFEISGTPADVAGAAANLSLAGPPPPPSGSPTAATGGPEMTEDDLEAIAAKVWAHIIGGGGAGATLEEVRKGMRDANTKLSKLCDPRNGNVDGTG
jgi:hypothetical protein